jgi:hypothetical protein
VNQKNQPISLPLIRMGRLPDSVTMMSGSVPLDDDRECPTLNSNVLPADSRIISRESIRRPDNSLSLTSHPKSSRTHHSPLFDDLVLACLMRKGPATGSHVAGRSSSHET